MDWEPLTHFIYVNLSAKDRQLLEQIAEERGATLSGVIRRLIRDAKGGRTENSKPKDAQYAGAR